MNSAEYSTNESKCLFQLLKERRVEEYRDKKNTLTGYPLWRLMSEQMSSRGGFERSVDACRGYWQKTGRLIYQFEAMDDHRPGPVVEVASFTDNQVAVSLQAQKTSDIPAINTLGSIPLQQFLDDCQNAPPPALNPATPRPLLYNKRHLNVNLNVSALNRDHVSHFARLVIRAGTIWGNLEGISLIGGGHGYLAILKLRDYRPSSRDNSTQEAMESKITKAFSEVARAFEGGAVAGLKIEFLGKENGI